MDQIKKGNLSSCKVAQIINTEHGYAIYLSRLHFGTCSVSELTHLKSVLNLICSNYKYEYINSI